jgi:N-acetylglucosaminyldiphosphoundecaprenol N-acetyl-beta-D-mannosaminyltransferase
VTDSGQLAENADVLKSTGMKASADMPTFNVLGLGIAATSPEEVATHLEWFIRSGRRGFITLTGVHGVMESRDKPLVKTAHERAYIRLPDGMPLVVAGHLKGFRYTRRCFGPDMMLTLMERSLKTGWKHFFYGGRPGVAEELRERMVEKFPGVRIVGTFCPPFRELREDEIDDFKEQIRQSGPDIVWVGLSTPKQELWMADFIDRIDVALMIGVGAAFDYNAGHLARAPGWMQACCLEWLYRLCLEPKRLWKRYLMNNPRFLFYMLKNAVTGDTRKASHGRDQ